MVVARKLVVKDEESSVSSEEPAVSSVTASVIKFSATLEKNGKILTVSLGSFPLSRYASAEAVLLDNNSAEELRRRLRVKMEDDGRFISCMARIGRNSKPFRVAFSALTNW